MNFAVILPSVCNRPTEETLRHWTFYPFAPKFTKG